MTKQENKRFWNVFDLFKTFRADIDKESRERLETVFSEVNRKKLLFIDNQWIMFNYPKFLSSKTDDIIELLCVGIMKRWINPVTKQDELLIIGTTDTGEYRLCLLENIQDYQLLIIPTNNNYPLETVLDSCIVTSNFDGLINLINTRHKDAERYWSIRPGLKPIIVDTHGEIKALNNPDSVEEEHQEEMEHIQEKMKQNAGIFPVQIFDCKTNKPKTIHYVVPLDFFDEF